MYFFGDCNQFCDGKQAINKYTDGQNFDTSHRELKYTVLHSCSLALHEFCLNKLSPEFNEQNNTYKPLKSLKGVRILSPTLSSSIMT